MLKLGLISRKGRYIILGLPNSGKTSLMKLLLKENLIDPLPYSNISSLQTQLAGKFHE